jgi:single-strand DNA-binding protein
MANLNKVMLIGRLTRDPETRMFANGGKVAKFGFAVNNKRKNAQTGQWEDDPVFLSVEAFNRGEFGKTADVVEQYLRKGSQAFIEGHLVLDKWTSAEGQKREMLKVVVDVVQFLDPKPADGSRGGPMPRKPMTSSPSGGMPDESYEGGGGSDAGLEPPPSGGRAEDIPF